MATLTITTQTATGSDYLHNLARAARALLAAVTAVPHRVAAPAQTESRQVSILRLYRIAAQYDCVAPSLAQELRAIAARSDD